MELRHLRYFIAVAEEQNVTRAAARLHVAQPSLSRQIRDLEDELDVALFDHSAKALRLTEAGRIFLAEAKAVIQRTDEAVKAVKAAASGQSGEIHVGYAPSLTVEILPRTLRHFQEAHPGVRVQLHDMSTQEMLRGLREEKLDVALLVEVSAKVMAGLVFVPLQSFAASVAVNPDHPLTRAKGKVGIDQLAGEKLIAYTLAEYPEYHYALAKYFAQQQHPPIIAEEHDGVSSLIASVEAGRGIALVPQGFESMTGPRLKIIPLDPSPPPMVVGMAYRKDNSSPVTHKFIAAVKKANVSRAGAVR